jgi:hypothetical protein
MSGETRSGPESTPLAEARSRRRSERVVLRVSVLLGKPMGVVNHFRKSSNLIVGVVFLLGILVVGFVAFLV